MASALTLKQLQTGFIGPAEDARVMMRWWWFGPAIDEAEIDRELAAMAAAGLGGVELAFVYPLGEATTTFGSPRFHQLVRHAATRARELGLRFDVTLGSGWSFGGPHIGIDHAARQLHWDTRGIDGHGLEVPIAPAWPGDEVIAAYLSNGAGLEDADGFSPLEVVDGALHVPSGYGPRTVTIVRSRLTGQMVKRAAAGAEGPVLDHYSPAATRAHLQAVAEPLLAALDGEPVGSVFCDSLEVYHADWTPELLNEFASRRGYAARDLLYLLRVEQSESARFRADYYRTLSELYAQNFVATIGAWAREHGVPFRIQSYGTPPASLASYAGADICEGEGWRWTGIPETRWASSAAHALGRNIVSAETWTWVHSPTFRATPLDLQGEAHEHFLNGVNHLIGHGWPYSPTAAPGLGWSFYAAGALDDRNPWWPAMPGLSRQLQRLCWLLRQGEPVRDVAVYVPADAAYDVMGPSVGGSLNLWQQSAALIGTDVAAVIRTHGWDFDLIDDDTLGVSGARSVLVLVAVASLSDGTRRWLANAIAAGTAVLAIECGELGLDGLIWCTRSDLADELAAQVTPDVMIDPAGDAIGVVHRRVSDTDVYFVANTGNITQSFTFAPRTAAAGFQRWDPATGQRSDVCAAPVPLILAPYQATVIVSTSESPESVLEQPATPTATITLADGWRVTFLGDPAAASRPVTLPHRWEDDPARAEYSGAAAYDLDLELTADESADRLVLDLGECVALAAVEPYLPPNSYRSAVRPPIPASAQIIVNGAVVTTLWAPPYTVDLTGRLTAGGNLLRIVVANTAANRLTTDQTIRALEGESTQRYGRRFRMQHLDHAGDALASGLLQVPTLQRTRSTG